MRLQARPHRTFLHECVKVNQIAINPFRITTYSHFGPHLNRGMVVGMHQPQRVILLIHEQQPMDAWTTYFPGQALLKVGVVVPREHEK